MKLRYYILLFISLLFSCTKEPGALFFHPSTEIRVNESINEVSNIPVNISIDTNDFSFAVFGDTHITKDNIQYLQEVAKDTLEFDIDFCIIAGDITDNGSEIEFENSIQDLQNMQIPFYTTIGNHDLYNKKGWERWKQYFGPSCYTINIENYLRIIFLDSAEGLIGKTQFEWLENTLKGNSSRFTIIVTHYPLYDDFMPYIWRLSSAEERYKIISLTQKYNVDAYFSGHLHSYQYSEIGTLKHFITGSLNDKLDKGTRGYLLVTISNGILSWKKIEV